MDQEWMRHMEARMIKVEEGIKSLAPLDRVREMIDPLQLAVKELAFSIQQLTRSDQELKELHNQLMIDRAAQEKEKHELEVATLKEQLNAQITANQRRGMIVFIKEKFSPTTGAIITTGGVIGLLYALISWLKAHIK